MSARYRIPITAITVFGASSLLAFSVAVVLYLGFNQAAETTRQLWADQAKTLIDAMESSLDTRLQPVRAQALWVARDIKDISNPDKLDDYFFGVLAATPQVAGIAVIAADGSGRRWHRDEHEAINHDWSDKSWINDYLGQVKSAKGPQWRAPIFTDTLNSTTLLHDVPLYDTGGKFIGVFAQIVTIKELSNFLATNYSDTGVTPFVLYGHDHVLAHPSIDTGNLQKPLTPLEEVDDLVLQRIWAPDDAAEFISTALTDTEASGVYWGNHFYLFLYREIDRYGPSPWTVGAHLNTTLQTGSDVEQVQRALLVGICVLVLAIVASIIVGRKVSSPVKAIARAADAVDSGDLDAVTRLGPSHIRELDDAGNAFNNMVKGLRERRLIRETLGRFVPEKIATSLLDSGGDIPVQQTEATILFCDIEAFTRLTETLGPVKIVDVLNAYFSAMVEILERHGGVVTQFQGDAILATFNVPITDAEHASRAIRSAQEMLEAVEADLYEGESIGIRIGINSGSVVAGAIGARGRLNYTVHGDAVNLAARLEALNKEYGTRLLVAESSARQAGDCGLKLFTEASVRGQSQSIKLYTLASFEAGEEKA